MRQVLQILTGALAEIVKTKKGKLIAYFAKKLIEGIFHNEQVKGAVMFEEFKSLCLNKVVFKNVLKRSLLKIIFRIDP